MTCWELDFHWDDEREFDDQDDVNLCELCGEVGTDRDPIAHFKSPTKFGEYTMAHSQCGTDAELELA